MKTVNTINTLQKMGFNIFAKYREQGETRWIMNKGNKFIVCYEDKTVFGTMNGVIQYINN